MIDCESVAVALVSSRNRDVSPPGTPRPGSRVTVTNVRAWAHAARGPQATAGTTPRPSTMRSIRLSPSEAVFWVSGVVECCVDLLITAMMYRSLYTLFVPEDCQPLAGVLGLAMEFLESGRRGPDVAFSEDRGDLAQAVREARVRTETV